MPFAEEPGPHALAAVSQAEHRPLWLDSPARPAPRPPLEGSRDTDLLIVGAGLSGLWTAVRAKERRPDLDVVLLEGSRIANAASGRNGGFMSASITHGHLNGIRRWPQEFRTLYELGLANLAGIEKTIADHGIDCGYHRAGELDVATEAHQVAELAEHAQRVAEYGVDLKPLDVGQARTLVDSPSYRGALLDPHVGLVDPALLSWGLARVAESLGVHIHENTAVLSVERNRGGMRARTVSGQVATGRAVLTTAAHSPLLRRIKAYVIPVFDHVVATAPLPGDLLTTLGGTDGPGVSDSGNQFHYYRVTPDRRLLWGGYDAVYSRGERPGSSLERDDRLTARLVQHMHDTFPQLGDVPIDYTWAGAIDTCSRFCGFWGTAHGGRLAYAAGYTGLGVGASRFGADVVLDLLTGEDTARTRLKMVRSHPLPFPPEPVRQLGIDITRRSLQAADANGGRRNLWLRTLDRIGLGFDS